MLNFLNTISYEIDGRVQKITDIVNSVILKRLNIDKTFLYLDEFIHPNEKPEEISYRIYGDVRYWGIILLVNDIVDPYTGLPMDNDLLIEYVKTKYDDIYDIHWFYDNASKRICDDRFSKKLMEMYRNGDELPHNITPVSHLDYESKLNENKMTISVVNPRYIHTFEEILMNTIGTK